VKKLQRGNSLLIILLIVALALGVVGFVLMKTNNNEATPADLSEKINPFPLSEDAEFEPLSEEASTPIEINNEAVGELDDLIDSTSAGLDEDLSDLDL